MLRVVLGEPLGEVCGTSQGRDGEKGRNRRAIRAQLVVAHTLLLPPRTGRKRAHLVRHGNIHPLGSMYAAPLSPSALVLRVFVCRPLLCFSVQGVWPSVTGSSLSIPPPLLTSHFETRG